MCAPNHWEEKSDVKLLVYKHNTGKKGEYYYDILQLLDVKYADPDTLMRFIVSLDYIGDQILSDYQAENSYILSFKANDEKIEPEDVKVEGVGNNWSQL